MEEKKKLLNTEMLLGAIILAISFWFDNLNGIYTILKMCLIIGIIIAIILQSSLFNAVTLAIYVIINVVEEVVYCIDSQEYFAYLGTFSILMNIILAIMYAYVFIKKDELVKISLNLIFTLIVAFNALIVFGRNILNSVIIGAILIFIAVLSSKSKLLNKLYIILLIIGSLVSAIMIFEEGRWYEGYYNLFRHEFIRNIILLIVLTAMYIFIFYTTKGKDILLADKEFGVEKNDLSYNNDKAVAIANEFGKYDRVEKYYDLKQKGIISEEEFDSIKKRILEEGK